MAFNLVYLSQQDPQWKNDKLGFGTGSQDTIGYVGCALTSVAMLLSGYGFPETPKSLNQKLKDRQGFAGSGIRWNAVCEVHPEMTLRANIRCETSDAPLGQIDAALDAGQPVVVRVDASPNPGLQWHYVLLYARQGDDYLMLDPWPYQPGTAKPDLLMKRYSQGNPLRRSIQQVLLYEASGGGGPISIPSSTSGTTMPSTQPGTAPATSSGVYARVMDSVTWGLNIRSSKDASSRANIITAVKAGTQLMLLDPAEVSKIGGENQWVHVREPGGREGFVAAQYLERVGAATPASPSTPAASSPGPSTTSGTSGTTSTPDPSTTPGTTTPPAAPARLILVVSEEVGTSGLRLRKTPSLSGAILKVLQAGTELTVLEPEGKARAKLGQSNKWIQVSEPGGKRGYVSAMYVRLA